MPIDSLVTATVKKSVNTLLGQDPQSAQRLARLQGKVMRVRFTDINKQLVFVFGTQIDVLASFDGEPDCDLGFALTVLPQLKDKANFTQLLKEEKLHLDGDLDVAQHVAQLLSGLNPDVAEWLSKYTGDVVAHSIVRTAKEGAYKLKSFGERKQRYVAELLIEEWRLAPGALEIAHFADRVDDVNSQVSRLESRFAALEKQWKALEKGQVNDT